MLRSRWIAGPAAERLGPLVVALTDFRMNRALDLPGIARRGLSLSRLWPTLPGAVGMWLWVDVVNRRVGSLSVWRDEGDLQEFIRLRAHVQIMREYRHRGTLRSRTSQIGELTEPPCGSLAVLNHSTHSAVANSMSAKLGHGPRRLMSSVFSGRSEIRSGAL